MSTHTAGQYGPSALGGDAKRFIELTTTLARTEFKLRYFGSLLGYVWSLMRPLLFFGILYLFFTKILDIGRGIPHYGVYLLTSIMLWNYFAEATGNCVSALVMREGLLRKVRFPRMVVPLSVSLTAAFNLGMNFIAVVAFALADGVTPTFRWLEMIPITGAFIVLATGIGMLLSTLYVRFRDVQPIWDVGLQAWFYCSPIMYTAKSYNSRFGSSNLEHLAMANPVGALLTQMGHAVIGGAAFPAAFTVGGPGPILFTVLLIPTLFGLGWWVFTHQAPRVAEIL
jgi:ABC-2 type transport system permease protein